MIKKIIPISIQSKFILLITIVTLLLTGCNWIKQAFTPVSMPMLSANESEYLLKIADKLSIKPTYHKTTGDICTDIIIALDNVETPPANYLSDETFERLCKLSFPEEEKTLREYHAFIKKIHGKRIIIIDSEHHDKFQNNVSVSPSTYSQ